MTRPHWNELRAIEGDGNTPWLYVTVVCCMLGGPLASLAFLVSTDPGNTPVCSNMAGDTATTHTGALTDSHNCDWIDKYDQCCKQRGEPPDTEPDADLESDAARDADERP